MRTFYSNGLDPDNSRRDARCLDHRTSAIRRARFLDDLTWSELLHTDEGPIVPFKFQTHHDQVIFADAIAKMQLDDEEAFFRSWQSRKVREVNDDHDDESGGMDELLREEMPLGILVGDRLLLTV